ncbi:uncharacterized protein CTRU02_204728 [Colletotrichum truncatum]|uniref:Uncharacterized protein n=1 Tax=Colletotrichum truncatum TaxID=5467 RepID=A0ACC3ZCX1_COLTU|nr:uncharacterized protein CTRU02_02962 [Colletotrichum truncatum]KAF6797920.1 hypothetical protein CTRU02_02962 [Colletotrichum truncatum]
MANSSTDDATWVSELQLSEPPSGFSAPELGPCAHSVEGYANKKRLIVCCDGTWNNSNQKGNIATNVSRLAAAVAHKCCTGMPQVVYYHRGAGTEESKVAQYLGGVFGKGVKQDIADVYRFICDNYNPGDELFIIGFSRGAFTARSVSGMVCSIGLLNRVGLANFGDIFHDYQNFPKWKPGTSFNKEDHLVGFTLSNYERLERFKAADGRAEKRDHATMRKDLEEEKNKFFEKMVQCKSPSGRGMDLALMAKKYRDLLEKHQMILCEKKKQERDGKQGFFFVPLDVQVEAVGVWDTVGSLGWPKMPWEKIRRDRHADELRFASLNVHPNVKHAFHALALDEWRTAFSPTLWGKKGNSTTKLRQVWFPGSHSNVGGGWEDQQIATIALAWMADQLSSVGVEFSTPEMKRIFWTLEEGVEAREWAKGKISSPSATSALPDKAYNAVWYPWQRIKGVNTVAGTRTPGGYKEDGGKAVIEAPNELIHPSVRIRYLYDGLGLDDAGEWDCPALTGNGYKLEKSTEPSQIENDTHKSFGSVYETLSGKVSSVHGGFPVDSKPDQKLVVHQLPYESDLYQLEEAANNWVWAKADNTFLREERIGMWERLFISINHKLLERQTREKLAREEQERRYPTRKSLREGLRSWVGDRVENARGVAGDVLNKTLDKLLPTPEKLKPLEYPPKFGYHDFVSWQRGDTSARVQRV